MAPKAMLLLSKLDGLLLNVEILAIFLLVIIPTFSTESIIDFTWSSSLSLGISRYRRLIGTTSALPPNYIWLFWLERTVTFYVLTLYHRRTKYSGMAFCFYLLSTICSFFIVYYMPTRKWQGLPKNPNPRKANKGGVLVQKVEMLQRLMFWLERVVVLVCIFEISRFARFSTVFFCFSDFIYLVCFALSLEVDPLPAKPDYLFWIERLAIVVLNIYCIDQTPYSLFIARGLFFLTNSCYSVNKVLRSRAYNPKLRESEKRLQAEKNEAKIEDDLQQEKFEDHEVLKCNWEQELVTKYGYTDPISEFPCTKIEDELPNQKSEVHHQDENNSLGKESVAKYGYMDHISELTCTEPKDTIKYETEEEAPKEERYNCQEALAARYGLMEHVSEYTGSEPKETKTSEIEEAPKAENYKSPSEEDLEVAEAPRCFDDMSSEEILPYDYFFQVLPIRHTNKFDNNWEEQLVVADQIDNASSNDISDLVEDNTKTAENESNKEALLEDTGEVERLRAENDNLKREKEALESEMKALKDQLKAERREHEGTRQAWKMHNQKLDGVIVEAKMKSQALVEELDYHSKFEEQMLETLKTYKEDCRKWEQESKDIGAKFEEVIAAIGKDQKTLLNGQGHVCKFQEESKKWKSEKIILNKQLEEANYWNQYYMQSEIGYGSWMLYYENYIWSLVNSNTDLARRLEVETRLSTRYHNRVFDYKERCRALKEDKKNLTAKLCAANASSELYRSMLHDLAS